MNDFKGKKMLFLGGSAVNCKYVQAAKDMGIYTIVTDISKNAPAKDLADEALFISVFDVDALVDFCRKNDVNAIGNFTNTASQKSQQKVAEILGMPTYGSELQVLTLTEKKVFKQFCRDHDVDVIEEYTEDDVLNNCIKYPVMVKPDDNSGSRGIELCYNREFLLKSLIDAKASSINGEILLERYMQGCQDLTITYLVKDGEPMLISLGDRYPGRKEDNLSRQLSCTIQPSRYLDMYLKNVNNKVINMIKALGVKNGPVFMQGFVDGDTVRMYDPGIRFPGNEYELILKYATGVDVMKEVVSYLAGGKISDYNGKLATSYLLGGKRAIQYIINAGPGKITAFSGLEEIATLPYVVEVQQRHFVGENIFNTGDIQHRAGEISILVGQDSISMRNAVEQVQKYISIIDQEGRSQVISAFNPQIITDNY